MSFGDLRWGSRWGEYVATTLHKLSAQAVERAKPGRLGDGGGLWLVSDPPRKDGSPGRKRWLFLFRWQTKLKEMGLGGYPAVSLAKARQRAQAARDLLVDGINPIAAKRASGERPSVLFGCFALELIDDLKPGWRNSKHAAQWEATLRAYAGSLWNVDVADIDTAQVVAVLKPIWMSKSETASRVRGRIETILDAAKAKNLRTGENPARWRGHLDHLLPKQSKLRRGHHAALSHAAAPSFMAALREREGVAALALEFAILTAARTNEVLGARWQDIDLAAAVWTISAERMKGGRPHRVPLSGSAIKVLDRCGRAGELVFPSASTRKAGELGSNMLSNGAMERVLDRMKLDASVTVHGFRSTFRDWAGEVTSFPRELSELALAHVVGDETELAYRRGDALERRRELMDAWAHYLDRAEVELGQGTLGLAT